MSTMMPAKIDVTTSLNDRADTVVRKLQDRLRSARRELIGQRIGIGACSIFGLFAIALAASATADWILELATA